MLDVLLILIYLVGQSLFMKVNHILFFFSKVDYLLICSIAFWATSEKKGSIFRLMSRNWLVMFYMISVNC